MRSAKYSHIPALVKSGNGKRRPNARMEVAVLEQRILCSATLHPSVPWESPTHTGILVDVRPHSLTVGAKPLAKTVTVSGKPAAPAVLAAPSGLTASLKTSTSAQLNWTGAGSPSGYYVLRATDGGGFSRIATLSGSTTSYINTALATGHTYKYEVQAYNGKQTSAASNIVSVTVVQPPPTVPTAPASLTASLTGSWVNLAWTDTDASATGYQVLRSTDGTNYTVIAAVTSGLAASYVDATVLAGQAYSYQVAAYNSVGTSPLSNATSITAPAAPTGNTVSIDYRFGNELVVTGTGANDSISVTESGSTLTIIADGQTSSYPAPSAGLFIYTRGGGDGISIASSVTASTTIMTIDGASTAINSSSSAVSVWMDSTDTFSGSGTLHKVSSFAGGVSKAVGASLADPTDAGTTMQINLSLFGTGPVAGDVNQGYAADCYFLSSLAAFAGEKPSVLLGSAVDMGDGTYAVQFMTGATPTYVRVSNDFSAGPFNGYGFAHPGANNTIWAMVMEKAFCYFRTGANTYASTNSGWMGEVYSDFGVSSSNFIPAGYSETAFFNLVSSDLARGEAVTLATNSPAPDLVEGHGYTLVSASIDGSGVTHYVVRNPWGFSGDALEDGQGYATLTFAQITANFFEGVQALG